jgi:DNA mismatch repair protein MutL
VQLAPAADAVWILSACKMAVKAGDPLAPAEMERLLLDLAETENPYFCPHGRPITLVLHRGDLMRKFKRC